jgi:hypothetical protein
MIMMMLEYVIEQWPTTLCFCKCIGYSCIV